MYSVKYIILSPPFVEISVQKNREEIKPIYKGRNCRKNLFSFGKNYAWTTEALTNSEVSEPGVQRGRLLNYYARSSINSNACMIVVMRTKFLSFSISDSSYILVFEFD